MPLSLPQSLYCADQVRVGERKIAADLKIPMYELMERAGAAVFAELLRRWPAAKTLLVCCGSGNNAGDGYVIARLAKSAGLSVTVWAVSDPEKLTGDAQTAYQKWLGAGGTVFVDMPTDVPDVVVDALFGTGLCREISGRFLAAVEWINAATSSVISVDIPSGLDADSGRVWNIAVQADVTVTLIAVKRGLTTGKAAQYVGELVWDGLGVDARFHSENLPDAELTLTKDVENHLPPRDRTSHKGDFGRLLCIGGDIGMAGAICLCSQAAIRAGAGLVSTITQPENATVILSRQPEIMVKPYCGVQDESWLVNHVTWSTAIALGPGLGNSLWSSEIYQRAIDTEKPLVVDADGLNFLAQSPIKKRNWILTPHPGEAARLLAQTTKEVELDRFSAVKAIQAKYGGVVVLKGAGTIIYDGEQCSVVMAGNPGMASGGMGDVLTGVIGALVAQSLPLFDAARIGSFIHGRAGDIAAQQGERGMVASDLLKPIRQQVNNICSSK